MSSRGCTRPPQHASQGFCTIVLQVPSRAAGWSTHPHCSQGSVKEILQWISESDSDKGLRQAADWRLYSKPYWMTVSQLQLELTPCHQFAQNNLVKKGFCTTKTREKFIFDEIDLDNCITSLWTDSDIVFMHEEMRSKVNDLFQTYLFTGARIGAFIHNFPREVREKNSNTE